MVRNAWARCRFGLPSRAVPVIHGARSLPEVLPGCALTLGAFDGVHLGHQALIARATAAARQHQVLSLGYTFHPHPTKVLAPAAAAPTLMGVEERARVMLGYGLDRVLVEPFDLSFSEVDRDQFVEEYLLRLSPRHVVVGFNFAYGKGRRGDTEHLIKAGERHGFEVEIVAPVEQEGRPISSTRVRERLLAGDLQGAERLLGHRHGLTGTVVEGDRRGRTIGFPTANLLPEAELLPAFGVYATRVNLFEGDGLEPPLHGVTNIGRRPTFAGERPTIETFLLDFNGDLYGRRLRIELCAYLRPELRFPGLDALKAQLNFDVDQARNALAALPVEPPR